MQKTKTTRWVLTDVQAGIWEESFRLTPEQVGATGAWSIVKRTLHGGLCEGVEVVEVDNGALAFTILPTRGMGLWRGRYDGCAVGWRAPVAGPVHPQFVALMDHGGLGWLQGFDECVVRCGLESNGSPARDVVPDNNGNPSEVLLPLHGRIANAPARRVEVAVVQTAGGATDLVVSGIVEEGRLFGPCLGLETRITTRVGSNAVTLHDEVVNRNAVPRELQLLYHCNFGAPFLERGSRLLAPSREVAPRDARAVEGLRDYATYRGPTAGYVEQVYWHRLGADRQGRTLVLLRNRAGTKGVAVRFNVRQLPCFAQWKNTVGAEDGYCTGLEPGTNLPNAKPFERKQGRVIRLAPGQRYPVELTLELHTKARGVAGVAREIATLSRGRAPQVHPRPRPAWSP